MLLSQAMNRYLLPSCPNQDPNPSFSSSAGMLSSQRALRHSAGSFLFWWTKTWGVTGRRKRRERVKYREAGSRMESSGTRLWHERHRHHQAPTSHSNLGDSGVMRVMQGCSFLWILVCCEGRSGLQQEGDILKLSLPKASNLCLQKRGEKPHTKL